MVKNGLVIIADYADQQPLSIDELCTACQISIEFIQELEAYQIIRRRDPAHEQFQFDMAELRRIQTALRLQRDLEVNLAGVALVLDLLDELDELRAHQTFD